MKRFELDFSNAINFWLDTYTKCQLLWLEDFILATCTTLLIHIILKVKHTVLPFPCFMDESLNMTGQELLHQWPVEFIVIHNVVHTQKRETYTGEECIYN